MNVARAKDREAMAQAVEALAAERGVSCERDADLTRGRTIHLTLSLPRGLAVQVNLDGDSAQDRTGEFCLPWCVLAGSTARLSGTFGAAQGSIVNPYHRRKCTAFGAGWADFLGKLDAGINMAISGEAFQSAAQRGTA